MATGVEPEPSAAPSPVVMMPADRAHPRRLTLPQVRPHLEQQVGFGQRAPRGEFAQRRVGERVEQHHVGARQPARAAHRDQVGRARTGASCTCT